MTETKTIPWKTEDHLETPEDIAAYLEAVFEDGDPELIGYALGAVSRSKGMTEIAGIKDTFRTWTGKTYGPEFIDLGLEIGAKIYQFLQERFAAELRAEGKDQKTEDRKQ